MEQTMMAPEQRSFNGNGPSLSNEQPQEGFRPKTHHPVPAPNRQRS